jgi:hypothetical protein
MTIRAAVLAALLLPAGTLGAQARTGVTSMDRGTSYVAIEGSLGYYSPPRIGAQAVGGIRLLGGGRLYDWDDDTGTWSVELEGTLRAYFAELTARADGSRVCCAVGNPTLALSIGWTDGATVQARAGIGVALPVGIANGLSETADILGYFGRAQHGFWDGWDGLVTTTGVFGRGDLDWRDDIWIAGVDGAVGASIHVIGIEAGSAIAVYQLGGYVGVEPIESLALGVRAQVAGWTVGGGRDFGTGARPEDAQVSVVPFVRLMLDPAVFEVRATVNLDEPMGVTADRSIWAVHLRSGLEWTP